VQRLSVAESCTMSFTDDKSTKLLASMTYGERTWTHSYVPSTVSGCARPLLKEMLWR
jgi:hypothetical protein